MDNAPAQHLTQLLSAAKAGDDAAAAEAISLVYTELQRLARGHMYAVPARDTLQPTALVHEAYLRLFGGTGPAWESRAHFFNAAARAMQDLVVEQARRHASLKRGGDRRRVTLDERDLCIRTQAEDLLALDEALRWLETTDSDGARIVMLRYFAGLPLPDVAEAMGLSVATVKRHWSYARAQLRRRMMGEEPPDEYRSRP